MCQIIFTPIPLSKVIEGLTVIGGTGNTLKTVHSGLFDLSIPIKIKSSSGIVVSHSLISLDSVFFQI